ERYYAAEAEAQAADRGLWRCREPLVADGGQSSPLRVAAVHADASGNDHENLGDEYVTFLNAGEEPVDLTGWTVRDEAGHSYQFPGWFDLAPGATVTLYTGSGEDSAGALYWGAPDAVWNNAGDAVVVTNASGAVVVEYEY
ncbi:MAG TPA: lamin tail domain-containing protein, partial [Halobacteriales archaeon]|nr:lamin tail domain-containing protein [Halobacteriales archaeon]